MTKYQTIFALAEYTARNVAQSEDNWKHYLTTAARLYKYPFNEQIEYSCAMKSHFRKFGNQMSGSGNHLCNYARDRFKFCVNVKN